MTSRRSFLRGSAQAGIAAASLGAFPESIRRALAIPAHNATGTLQDVQHVVILMQENRAFDHYYGTLHGVRGFGDRFPIPLPDGRNVWQQRTATGQVLMPFHLDGTAGNAQRANGTPHDWNDSQQAWDHGRMDQWPRYKNQISMGYFEQAEIPFQFALANAFTICDAYHCSMHTGTDANRAFFLTGTNGAVPTGTAFVTNEWDAIDGLPGGVDTGYTWTTYAERLEQAGVRWISYQNMPDEWGDNMLGAFRQFKRANIASGYPVSSGGSPGRPYTQTGQAVPYKAYDPATDNAGNPLYKGIANTLPGTQPENYLDAFRRDIREGRLPQVSWMNAPSIYCEHPGPSSPVQGAWFLQEVLDALTAVPEVWSKTVLIVNFDENDGYFDHVPSPSAPSPDGHGGLAGKTTLGAAEMAAEYFTQPKPPGSTRQPPPDGRVYGPGPRVPMLLISPWSRGGWVNSQVFDHTSVLRFLEARFGVMEPNISPFRRAVCGDLTSAFNFATPNTEVLPVLQGRATKAQADALRRQQERLGQIRPPAQQQLPRQVSGTRPSRALPYELATHCDVLPPATRSIADARVRLGFFNTGRQAAVFHVYNRLDLAAVPRRYMVEPGKQLSDTWVPAAGGLYDLWVLGPDGYHRHFTGSAFRAVSAAQPRPELQVRSDARTGELVLMLANAGSGPCTFTLRSNAYRSLAATHVLAARSELSLRLPVADSGWWYDFSATVTGHPEYLRRFAGRVETGRHTVSDPALGQG
ncbi:phosphocholine-specific phospholipase C [Aquincola sp. J276]|uniref:phosphocholine-specific phospholipase C n=1 Tax=Aquincola sp. J276 TaxID=2898432 RepID=UPI0021514445|nr:phospholipase C, phosphocholine-specific [Aquincola sp. J276]MCR5864151.1 phospholipase C, phosphocholine-specific [Aquincola sp. J276]